VCGSRAVRLDGQAAKRCTNVSCPARLKETVRHFASRTAMDVEGLGVKLVEQLVDKGLVKNPADLYYLDRAALASLERMAEKSAGNIIDALNRSKSIPADRFLFSLGIPLVGEHVARILLEKFGDVATLSQAGAADLQQVYGIGPEVAQSVAAFFGEPRNRDMIQRLYEAGVNPVPFSAPATSEGTPLAGKTVVFTGTIALPRAEAKRLVESAGGKVSGSVSRKTDFVVVGDDPGSKFDKARELGLKTLGEDEFRTLLGLEDRELVAGG
jgi:DNA ligase (NAD+)